MRSRIRNAIKKTNMPVFAQNLQNLVSILIISMPVTNNKEVMFERLFYINYFV